MGQMLELSDKDFKAPIVKMLKWAIANVVESNENKIWKFQRRNIRSKEEPNVHFGTGKENNQYKNQWIGSTTEWMGKRKSVNVKMGQ